jgi:3-oxoacyl-[acyl-carrier protein] reductase
MELGLKNKTALITAGSKGIGKACAELLIAEGAKVAICSRSLENLQLAAQEIKRSQGIEPFWFVCDITKEKDINEGVERVRKELGEIEILINNCGGPKAGYFENLYDNDWKNAFDQVLLSAVRFSRAVIPGMIEKNWGRIINITSAAVKEPIENLMLSNSLRTGLIGFAKSLSNEIGKYNITVNNIAPGYTLTGRLYELALKKSKEKNISHEEALMEMASESVLKRLASPEEIASAVAFLASERASFITGITLVVDGGRTKSLF